MERTYIQLKWAHSWRELYTPMSWRISYCTRRRNPTKTNDSVTPSDFHNLSAGHRLSWSDSPLRSSSVSVGWETNIVPVSHTWLASVESPYDSSFDKPVSVWEVLKWNRADISLTDWMARSTTDRSLHLCVKKQRTSSANGGQVMLCPTPPHLSIPPYLVFLGKCLHHNKAKTRPLIKEKESHWTFAVRTHRKKSGGDQQPCSAKCDTKRIGICPSWRSPVVGQASYRTYSAFTNCPGIL